MLPDAMEEVARIGRKYGIKITNVFHAGDGNIHPIILFDEDDPEEVQRTLQLSEDILEYCLSIGGTIARVSTAESERPPSTTDPRPR